MLRATLLTANLCLAACAASSNVPTEAPFGERRTFGFACGGEAVTVTYTELDKAVIAVGSDRYDLMRVRTGSGERYMSADKEISFWSKADEALFERKGESMVECDAVNPTSGERDAEKSDLLDRTFRIQDIAGRGVPDEVEVSLQFGGDDRVSGSSGCNRYFGTYSTEGDGLRFGQMGRTSMACPSANMNVEAEYLAVLSDVKTASVTPDGELVLRTADGRELRGRPA